MNTLLDAVSLDFGNFCSSLVNVLQSFKPIHLVEIFIVGLLYFFGYRLLKGRKAGALAIGIVITFVCLFISTFLEFKVLSAILGAIASSGAVVIFVIFQPEIREFLEKIGNGSIHGLMSFGDRKKKKQLYYAVIDNICAAVKDLALESTGALIVIEKTIGLSDIVSTGVSINADVSSLLIRNLFYNKAPLHDGALVIKDGKIAAAGCFLPLTRRSDVDPDLGTRHRAAMGMAESSDAIVVVVSEETGYISIAHDGELMRNVSLAELRDFLTERLVRSSGNLVKGK